MTRRKKVNEEGLEVAQEIASVVEDKPKKVDEPVVPPAPVDAPKQEIQEVALEQARTSPNRSVRIKATATVRGVFRNIRYDIRSGEVYTFPEDMANWLIGQGRAI